MHRLSLEGRDVHIQFLPTRSVGTGDEGYWNQASSSTEQDGRMVGDGMDFTAPKGGEGVKATASVREHEDICGAMS